MIIGSMKSKLIDPIIMLNFRKREAPLPESVR